jgi:hemerythrin-like domain-containing protein
MLALRLQQGKKALLRDWSHDLTWQASHVVQFYRDHLVPHFKAEEKALFPVMKEHVVESAKTIDTLLHQHKEIREKVNSLEKPERTRLEDRLREFGELLDRHIRIEEDDLFPLFEKSVPKDIAEDAGREITRIDKPTAE